MNTVVNAEKNTEIMMDIATSSDLLNKLQMKELVRLSFIVLRLEIMSEIENAMDMEWRQESGKEE